MSKELIRLQDLTMEFDGERILDSINLYINDKGEYELHDIEMLETPECAKNLRGFMFERSGKTLVACWHTCGEEDVEIPFAKERRFKLAGLKYIETDLSLNEVKNAWKFARFVTK